jgi:hypothetical protein
MTSVLRVLTFAVVCCAALAGCELDRYPLSAHRAPLDAGSSRDAGASRDAGVSRDAPMTDAPIAHHDAHGEPDVGLAVDAGPSARCPPDPTLVACYPLDRDTRDHGPGGHDLVASTVEHEPTGGALFSSSSALASLEAPGLAHVLFTVASWVRLDVPTTSGTRSMIFDHDGVFGLWMQDDASLVCSANTTAGNLTTIAVAPVPLGQVSHVACVFDGASLAVYVDGALYAFEPAAGTLVTSSSPLQIGENGPLGDDQWIGMIDDVRLWDRALTALDIADDVVTGRMIE